MVSGHASGESVVAVTVAMTVCAALFCGMRLYARFGVAKNAGADDACIVLAMFFAVATTITMVLQVYTGMGRHQWEIDPEESVNNLKAFYVSIWVYNLSLTSTKVSILFQYLRIFPQKAFRICAWTLMGITVAYGLYAFLTAIFSCWPIPYFWDHTIVGGKCLNRFAVWFANSALNIATDVATAILPLPVLNNLELPRRQKRALMLVFALGGFTCIVSALRLQSLWVISRTDDISWNNGLAAIWSNVEINVAIICSCLPTIRCVFPKLFKSQLSMSGSGVGGMHTGGTAGSANRHLQHSRGGARDGYEISGGRSQPTTKSFGSSMKVPFNTTVTASSTTSYPMNPYRSADAKFDAAYGDEDWRVFQQGKRRSHVRRENRSDDIEMLESLAGMPNGRIHVTTAIDQVEEKRPDSPAESGESIKDVARPKTYDAI